MTVLRADAGCDWRDIRPILDEPGHAGGDAVVGDGGDRVDATAILPTVDLDAARARELGRGRRGAAGADRGGGEALQDRVLGYTDAQKLAGPLATEVEFLSHKDSEKKGKTAKKMVV